MRSDQRDWLHQRSITTLSDLVQYDATSSTWSWADFTSDDAPWFKDTPFYGNKSCPQETTTLHQHQLWSSANQHFPSNQGYIFEILAFHIILDTPMVIIRVWEPHPGPSYGRIRKGYTIQHPDPSTNLITTGIVTAYSMEELFIQPIQAITTGPSYRRKSAQHVALRTIQHIRPSSTPIHPFTVNLIDPEYRYWQSASTNDHLNTFPSTSKDLTIYTDGS